MYAQKITRNRTQHEPLAPANFMRHDYQIFEPKSQVSVALAKSHSFPQVKS